MWEQQQLTNIPKAEYIPAGIMEGLIEGADA